MKKVFCFFLIGIPHPVFFGMEEENLEGLLDAIIDDHSIHFFHYLEECHKDGTLKKTSFVYYTNPLSLCLEYDRHDFAKAILERDPSLLEHAHRYISSYAISKIEGEEYTGDFAKKTISELVSSFGVKIDDNIIISALESENEEILRYFLEDVGYSSFDMKDLAKRNNIDVPTSLEKMIDSYDPVLKEPIP